MKTLTFAYSCCLMVSALMVPSGAAASAFSSLRGEQPIALDSTLNVRGNKAKSITLPAQLSFSGYAINQFIADAGKAEFKSKFARLKLKVTLNKRFASFLQVDAASTPILRDLAVDARFHRLLSIRFGQYKYKFGNYLSPWEWVSISKPMIQSRLFDDHRDSGMQVSGAASSVNYAVSLINGTGRGVSDDDEKKTLVGSANLVPLKGLQIGGSFYLGSRNLKSAGGILIPSAKMTRFGGQIWLDRDPVLLQSEVICAKNGEEDIEGYYVILGYKFFPSFQMVFRNEQYNSRSHDLNLSDKINAIGFNYIDSESSVIRVIHEWKKISSIWRNTLIFQAGIAF